VSEIQLRNNVCPLFTKRIRKNALQHVWSLNYVILKNFSVVPTPQVEGDKGLASVLDLEVLC